VGKGDALYLKQLADLSAGHGVRLVVHDQVPPAELADFFNAADICAWPADNTVSHIEAAACGKAIIIPSEDGIRDRIDAGNGLAVRAGDVASLGEALARLLSDRDLRHRMGEAGRRMVVEKYSLAATTRRLERLYHDPSPRRTRASEIATCSRD
jgi:glycosyltransferase involved in cell wall biosynthesis